MQQRGWNTSRSVFFVNFIAGDEAGLTPRDVCTFVKYIWFELATDQATWSGANLPGDVSNQGDSKVWGGVASEAEALSQAVSRLQSVMQSTQSPDLTAKAAQVRVLCCTW